MAKDSNAAVWSAAFEALKAQRDAAAIPQVSSSWPAPLTDIQEALWPNYARTPQKSFADFALVPIHGPLDVDTLHAAFLEVVRVQHVLRTKFPVVGGVPRQLVMPDLSKAFDFQDLRDSMSAEQIERQLDQFKSAFVNLVDGPPYCASLLPVSDSKHMLLLGFHHLCFDGWSRLIFARELCDAYGAISDGTRPGLPDLPIQVTDLAHWQQGDAFRELAEGQVQYWRGALDGLGESPRLFAGSYRDGEATAVARAYTIPQTTVEGLRSLRSETGATLYMMLLASFKILFRQDVAESDVCVEARMANRARPEMRRLIGPCANVALLRTDLGGDPTFRELLQRVRGTVLGALGNIDVSAKRVYDILCGEGRISTIPSRVQTDWRTGSGQPLKLGAAAYGEQRQPVSEGPLLGRTGEPVTANFADSLDLILQFQEFPDELALTVIHRPEHISGQDLDALIARYKDITLAMLTSPDRRLSTI